MISFKGPLGFYRNVKDSYTILEKAKQNKKEFKLDLNKIKVGKREHKSVEQKVQ